MDELDKKIFHAYCEGNFGNKINLMKNFVSLLNNQLNCAIGNNRTWSIFARCSCLMSLCELDIDYI